MKKLPKPTMPGVLSTLEAEFNQQLMAYGIVMVREHKFHPARRWRFDFAIPALLVAVEIEGGTRQGLGHSTHSGITRDCEKGNAAVLLGWRVLRGTSEQVKNLKLIDTLKELLQMSLPVTPNVTGEITGSDDN